MQSVYGKKMLILTTYARLIHIIEEKKMRCSALKEIKELSLIHICHVFNGNKGHYINGPHAGMLPPVVIKIYQFHSHSNSLDNSVTQSFRLADKGYYQSVVIFIIAIIEQFHPRPGTERSDNTIYPVSYTHLRKEVPFVKDDIVMYKEIHKTVAFLNRTRSEY